MSREDKDKKTKRNQLIIGIILIGIMVFGTLGYAFSDKENTSSEKIEYNGVEFVKNNEYWNFNLNGDDFATKYNPEETENISFVSIYNLNNYANNPLYIVGDFNGANFEISRNLNRFVSRINPACLSEYCKENYPIKNCSLDNIIIIREPAGEKENIYSQDKCVFITSSIENQTRYVDAFLFKILGI